MNASKTQLMLGGKVHCIDLEDFHVVVDRVTMFLDKKLELLGVKFDSSFSTFPHGALVAASARRRAAMIASLSHHLPKGAYLQQLARILVLGKCSYAIGAVFIALAVLATVASAAPMADNPAPYQPAPYKPTSYKEPAYEEPAKYEYQYGVQDQYAGLDFAQNEARDGYATNGEYRVNLPDGRTQIVTYNVQDDASGYVADVRYEGEAQYPKEEPKSAYQPAPNDCDVFITLAVLAAVASAAPMADNPAPYQPAPYQPAPYKPTSYKEPAYEEPAKYEYQYGVQDQYAGLDFAQNEARDGYATNGEYRVNLPDGRTQIVTYNVQDDASGYVADVRYEGEAQYPKEEPKSAYQPAHKYAPTPKYAPAPSYSS
eukprot:maker-scaffold304_size215464-snap-gene-1.21 protein:Tk10786 transcript:maker-scaffold304_size215464-snap-gene-1.21-mRNA-1 annotation:"cuticle protein"